MGKVNNYFKSFKSKIISVSMPEECLTRLDTYLDLVNKANDSHVSRSDMITFACMSLIDKFVDSMKKNEEAAVSALERGDIKLSVEVENKEAN